MGNEQLPFMFGVDFNFGQDGVFTDIDTEYIQIGPIPVPGHFLLLDGSDFLLLDGEKLALL